MQTPLKYKIVELNLLIFICNFAVWSSTYFFYYSFFYQFFCLTSFEIPFFLGCLYLIFLKKAIYFDNIVKIVVLLGFLNCLSELILVIFRFYNTLQIYHASDYDGFYFISFTVILDSLSALLFLLTFYCCKLIQKWSLVCKTENRSEIVSLVTH